jgi:tetratricopeptide (TPR) repeat protein
MRIFLYLLVFMITLLPSSLATAQSRSIQAREACVEEIENATTALRAKDWRQLERIAKRMIQTCSGDTSQVSAGYEHLSNAYNRMHRPKEAFDTAVSCIDFSYRYSSGCQIQKAVALEALGRFAEARATLEIAERLARQALSQTESDIQDAHAELRLYNARKGYYQAQQRLIDILKKEMKQVEE